MVFAKPRSEIQQKGRSLMPYLINRNGQQFGPYSADELKQYVAEGRVLSTDLAWEDGMPNWLPVSQIMAQQGMPVPVPGRSPAPPSVAVKPDNYLVPAILVTLFCCLPLGVVSIVYAAQVDSKHNAGDHAGARQASETAKKWFLASLICGLAVTLLWVVFSVIGAMSGSH